METNKEHCVKESGNALIYVLIAIVLFAALSFTLSRQTDTSEAGVLADERAELYATQMISYTAQVKSVIDQMLLVGSDVDDLDFIDPSDAGFNAGTQRARADRVFHPEGGGLIKGRIADDAIDENITDPVAGWYLGRFNNVEWTASTGEEIILVAYQIRRQICEKNNEKITGSSVIPTLGTTIRQTLIDDSFYSATNLDLTTDAGTPICSACHEIASLCVENQAQNAYGFYTIIADQ